MILLESLEIFEAILDMHFTNKRLPLRGYKSDILSKYTGSTKIVDAEGYSPSFKVLGFSLKNKEDFKKLNNSDIEQIYSKVVTFLRKSVRQLEDLDLSSYEENTEIIVDFGAIKICKDGEIFPLTLQVLREENGTETYEGDNYYALARYLQYNTEIGQTDKGQAIVTLMIVRSSSHPDKKVISGQNEMRERAKFDADKNERDVDNIVVLNINKSINIIDITDNTGQKILNIKPSSKFFYKDPKKYGIVSDIIYDTEIVPNKGDIRFITKKKTKFNEGSFIDFKPGDNLYIQTLGDIDVSDGYTFYKYEIGKIISKNKISLLYKEKITDPYNKNKEDIIPLENISNIYTKMKHLKIYESFLSENGFSASKKRDFQK